MSWINADHSNLVWTFKGKNGGWQTLTDMAEQTVNVVF